MATDGSGGWSGVPVDAVARWFAELRGWRRHAVAAGLGTVATLALPPVYLLPVLYPPGLTAQTQVWLGLLVLHTRQLTHAGSPLRARRSVFGRHCAGCLSLVAATSCWDPVLEML